MTVKEQLHKIADELPEDASWDDASYKIYFLQKLERGLEDTENGKLFSPEEVRMQIRSRYLKDNN